MRVIFSIVWRKKSLRVIAGTEMRNVLLSYSGIKDAPPEALSDLVLNGIVYSKEEREFWEDK